MANLIKKIRTDVGDLQIDYTALANLPDLSVYATTKSVNDAINEVENEINALDDVAVKSINSILPDDNGNVTLGPDDIGALAADGGNISGSIKVQENVEAKSFVENGINLEDKYAQMAIRTVMLSASNWTTSNGTYTQSVSVDGILATDIILCDLSMKDATVDTAEDIQESWGYIGKIQADNGNITATCYTDKPTVDLSFNMLVLN